MLMQGTLVSLHATVNTRFAGLQPPSPGEFVELSYLFAFWPCSSWTDEPEVVPLRVEE